MADVAGAYVDIFAQRATHRWPPTLTVEPSWPQQYAALAAEQGFEITDVLEATAHVQALINALAAPRPGVRDP